MRKNKKILLGAIAAMSVLGIGVGATSTFAWYQATSANLASGAHVDATITTNTQKSIGNQNVIVTASWSSTNIGLSKADNTKVDKKAMVSGTPQDTTDTIVGYVTLSAALENEATLTPEEKTGLSTKTLVVTVSGQGNLILLSSSTRTNNSTEIAGNSTSVTVTYTYSAGASSFAFSGTGVVETNKMYFAVEPNNDNGYEVLAKKTWAATTPFSVGDAVEESSTWYVCKEAHTSSAAFGTDSAKWQALASEPALHSADKVHIA